MSLRRLKLERIDLYQLHRIDPKVPAEEQFGDLKKMQQEGKIRQIGLSEVPAEIDNAAKPFASSRSRTNTTWPTAAEDTLQYCEKDKIGFIPWFPVAAGELARPGGVLDEAAQNTMPRSLKWRWRGCSNAPASCCPFPAPRRSPTWRRTSPQPRSSWTQKNGTPWSRK